MNTSFPDHWEVLPFLDAVKDATSGNPKIQKGQYQDQGSIPIVDQGQKLIGGYTDDPSLTANVEAPTIVFGDHTRVFKFIDTPFCLGADGAKILEPKVNLDKKFLYYYLQQVPIESAGYSRHFKFLKEKLVPLPPLEEQKRIAAVLDKSDAIRRKRQQAIELADQFLRSVFLDMFGDPLHGSQKYATTRFGDLTIRITYGFTSPMQHVESGIPIVTAKHVQNGRLNLAGCHYALQTEVDALTAKSKPNVGDILITKDGTIGRCAVFDEDFPICINQSVALVQPDHDLVVPVYLEGYITNETVQSMLNGMGKGNALKHLQITELAEMPVAVAPIAEQRRYAEIVRKVRISLSKLLTNSDSLVLNLNACLQQSVFSTNSGD